MEKSSVKLKAEEIHDEVVKRLTTAGFKDNWVHGLPHIERVRKNFKLLLKNSKLNQNIAKCLEITVDLHDIGRSMPGNHTENSAKIFKEMEIEGLTQKEKDDIEFALRNHNKGLMALGIITPRENKEILLGLLCALDHLDGIGKIGILRTYQWLMESQTQPKILSDISLKKLKDYLKKGIITPEMRKSGIKEESVLAQLIYNYLATFEIIGAVRKFLGKDFLAIVEKRKNETLKEINYLIKLAEENQKVDKK